MIAYAPVITTQFRVTLITNHCSTFASKLHKCDRAKSSISFVRSSQSRRKPKKKLIKKFPKQRAKVSPTNKELKLAVLTIGTKVKKRESDITSSFKLELLSSTDKSIYNSWFNFIWGNENNFENGTFDQKKKEKNCVTSFRAKN